MMVFKKVVNSPNSMKQYELLDHTADAKFRAYGMTRDEAFTNSVRAMTAIATDPDRVEKAREIAIELSAKDLKGLLFDLLGEIIFHIDTDGFLPATAEDLNITESDEGYTLTARLVGDDAKKYGCNLKAPTYSEMIVEHKDGKWMVQAVVDI